MAKRVSTPVPAPASRKARTRPVAGIATHVPTREEIARRAFELYISRGEIDGSDVIDWLRAESELAAAMPTS